MWNIFKSFKKKKEEFNGIWLADFSLKNVAQKEGDEITFFSSNGEVKKNIDEVLAVVAYKVDCFAYDMVMIDVAFKDETVFRLPEESGDFFDQAQELLNCFGIEESEWFFKVTFPAFEENFTVLFENKINGD